MSNAESGQSNAGFYQEITESQGTHADAVRAGQLASLGELAAGVAHEINNPINGIINYAQILVNKSGECSEERDIARRIIKEGNRIAGIVSNLLFFARDTGGKKENAFIHEIISDTLALTEAQINKDGIKVIVSIPERLPHVYGQAQELEQVFLNIVINARYSLNQKYCGAHEDKILMISAKEITVEKYSYVQIVFHDRGVGIPAVLMDKIMNPFFTTKPNGSGTGLGLSISHGIISNHGGAMTVESIEGEFAKVEIKVPSGAK
jgi:signal transduction histidine kinase